MCDLNLWLSEITPGVSLLNIADYTTIIFSFSACSSHKSQQGHILHNSIVLPNNASPSKAENRNPCLTEMEYLLGDTMISTVASQQKGLKFDPGRLGPFCIEFIIRFP